MQQYCEVMPYILARKEMVLWSTVTYNVLGQVVIGDVMDYKRDVTVTAYPLSGN